MNNSSVTRIAISGAAGRMGRALATLAFEEAGLSVVGGTEAPNSPHHGADLGEVMGRGRSGHVLTSDAVQAAHQADVFIDFTRPNVTLSVVDALSVLPSVAMVVGTTGMTPEELDVLRTASNSRPIVYSGNYSLGVNMLAALVERAAASLGDDWDIEVLETHHRHKVDAPSGTALMLGEAAAKGRGADLDALRIPPYDGVTGERPVGKIGFSVRRSGGVIGEHDVTFGSEEEILTLAHTALNRNVFARGALRAAQWVKGRAPGLYSMKDVLGL